MVQDSVQVPIKSLPQEWLWCETWCSKESLKDAKSIDLCNNPLTKVCGCYYVIFVSDDDYSNFNTRVARTEILSVKKSIQCIFLPLMSL